MNKKYYLLLTVVFFIVNKSSFVRCENKSKDNSIYIFDEKYLGNKGVELQKNNNDCGVYALKMIFNYYGLKVKTSEISKEIFDSRGTNMLKMKKFAEKKGLKVLAYKMDIDNLEKIRFPAILHLKIGHFVVLDKFINKQFIISDPVIGKLSMSGKALKRKWAGNILIFLRKG
jgi:ATP-binding cassette subfamily B protein RaxB